MCNEVIIYSCVNYIQCCLTSWLARLMVSVYELQLYWLLMPSVMHMCLMTTAFICRWSSVPPGTEVLIRAIWLHSPRLSKYSTCAKVRLKLSASERKPCLVLSWYFICIKHCELIRTNQIIWEYILYNIVLLPLHYWMRGTHHCSEPPFSEMTYTVSSGMLKSTIPYIYSWLQLCDVYHLVIRVQTRMALNGAHTPATAK